MEKRGAHRIKVKLNAERISGNHKYGVFIENISEKGIHLITTHTKSHAEYFPGKDVDLKFYLHPGKPVNLRCKIRWACTKMPPNGMTDSIGLEIIDPPKQYIEFVKTLSL